MSRKKILLIWVIAVIAALIVLAIATIHQTPPNESAITVTVRHTGTIKWSNDTPHQLFSEEEIENMLKKAKEAAAKSTSGDSTLETPPPSQ